MIIYDYDVEVRDKQTEELKYTVPVATTSHNKAKEIAQKYLELMRGIPSIDYRFFVKRVYPGREGVIITEKDIPGFQEEGK